MTYSTTTISNCLTAINKDWFLPSIQRPYVWETDQIIRLFDSLMKGLPISTFLLWKMDADTTSSWDSYRFIEDFKQGDTHNIRIDLTGRSATYILDGQQRLTSLLIGFYGSYTVKAKFARKGNLNAWTQKSLYIDLLKSPDEISNDDDLDSDIGVTYGLDFFEREQRITPDNYWFRPAPQSAITDFQLGTGLGALHAGGNGIFDQHRCCLAMWGADHASSPSPPLSGLLSAALLFSNFQVGGIGQ